MIKKNQVIITALVIMVAVAGYLNYVDNNSPGNEILLNDEGDVAALVANDSLPANANIEPELGIALTNDNQDIKDKDDNKNSDRDNNKNQDKNKQSTQKTDASEPGKAVFVNKTLDSSYFVQAKLEREQARAKEKEILDEMINNKNLNESKRGECADEKIQIQRRIEKETAAESMIESKGFSEVYVRMDDNTVDVVVNKETLSEAEIAQIEDIVKRKTGLDANKIRISTIKK